MICCYFQLVGAWLFYEWYKVGAPQPLKLLEFGPGRGTMMNDILRVSVVVTTVRLEGGTKTYTLLNFRFSRNSKEIKI